jgi:hypothetical protein
VRRTEKNAQNMSELFDRCFLHDGHIGSGSSFFTFDDDDDEAEAVLFPASVDSVDWEVPPEEE